MVVYWFYWFVLFVLAVDNLNKWMKHMLIVARISYYIIIMIRYDRTEHLLEWDILLLVKKPLNSVALSLPF